ncbi:pantetheinase [Chrysochromulina tobinii]|uniref:Pantetheinase n=1 Tax=Chrysochromulina tobinii TaxID=1460289 RepID=A0A0M0JDU6_9EUKA|nr:pantetheinase [Chrysochromulina tobinii]|eukprot:KOO24769.1 pantetheinase [Chrysochromulina sp. CCMP291]
MRASIFVYFALLALPSATFKVAVVEYTAVSPCGAGSCGKQQRESSCADYAEYIEQAGRAGASLVVFPEYGITGFSSYPKSSWVSGGYVEAVPAVPSGRRVVPCDSPSTFANAPSVVSLSCVAKKHGIAVVANLMDYDGHNMYNTDVALDTDGAFLAKYPKQNLWGERNVDIPQSCPMASFTTSFNVTFGLITCADLIYEFPASRLVRERHVEHFVMPAAWSDEMAQMQEPPVTALADVPLTCATAVVGAGWAGIYAAWRLVVDAGALAPGDLCLFEARGKPGGRTYSVQVEGLVVDVGAYRFSKQQHLPSDLILERLELPTACYEPDCKPDAEFNQTLFKIVDTKGRNAGYVTPIRTMLAQLEAAGARVFFGHRLTGVYANGAAPTTRGGGSSGALTSAVSGSSSSLHFAGGQVVTASAVLLNLPRLVLQRLDPASIVFPTDTTQLSWQLLKNCTPCFDPSAGSAVPNWLAVKVYTQYDDPWWITKLRLEQGSFVDTEHSPPLVGRYHDGPVSRADDGSVDGPGLLEAVYAYTTSQPSIRYYEPFADDPAEDPLTITTDPALLLPLHRRLMEFHAAAFAKIGLNATRDVPPPTKVVLGIWTSDELAALPQPMSSNFRAQVPSCPAESCLDGVSAPQYNAATATPNPAANIHIANNDFAITLEQGVPCCWAEQSLNVDERRELGVRSA